MKTEGYFQPKINEKSVKILAQVKQKIPADANNIIKLMQPQSASELPSKDITI